MLRLFARLLRRRLAYRWQGDRWRSSLVERYEAQWRHRPQ
jgi:hypothetical protein